LLHDFDWERYPTLEEHPIEGCKKLRENGYDEDIIEAILGHNKATGIKRRSLMAKTLFAVDELSGLIVALARVRPGDFEGMSAKSVKKAMKKKDFAAAINRDDIRLGIEELGIGEEEKDGFFELVVKALDGKKRDLGF
jgi:predicted hydrolase (HD superfamily)